MSGYSDTEIAQMVHETLRVWAEVRDLDALPSWGDAPQWMQESTLDSVRYVLEHPHADGARQHEQWLSKKTADGWCWGETKDPDKKTHPLMVPYDELPNDEKAKDAILNGIVRSLANI